MSGNKGLTSATSESVAKQKESLKKYYQEHAGTMTGKKHSEETKKKISEARKKYLAEHPDKVPFKLNHSSKESYPEKYFRKGLKKEKLFDTQELQLDRYTLDFAGPDKKIYLEIDGSQHKLDGMQEHDRIRAEYLANLGGKCINRVDWCLYQTLSKKDKHYYLEQIKKAIVSSQFVEKFIPTKQKQLQKINKKRADLIAAGHISKKGYVASNVHTEETGKQRFNTIIKSNVDLTKFGGQEKVRKATSLTRRQISNTIKHYQDYFLKHTFIR